MEVKQAQMINRFTLIKLYNHALYAPDKKGEKWYEICNEVGVDRTLINLVTGEMEIHLKYWLNKEYHTIVMPRKDLTKAGLVGVLPARGIQVFEDSSASLLDYLLYQEKKAKVEYVHDQIGFKTINGQKIFLHYQAHSADKKIKSSYVGRLMIKPKGTLKGELDLIRTEILSNHALELTWVIGFTAPIVSYLRGILSLENIIIHAFGKSSTGKSSSSLLSISPWGLPSKSSPDGLFGTWMSTPNALIARLANNTGIPLVYDEASVQDSGSYGKIIYQMSAGHSKSRLSSDSTLKESMCWATCIISNAENALLTKNNYNTGLRVRVLQLSNIIWTKSAESSVRIVERLQDNYGNSGIAFIEYLLAFDESVIVERFKDSKKEVLNAITKRDDFTSRASDKLAIIYLTAQLVNEVFNIGINVQGILEMLVEADSEQIQERDIGLQAYLSVKESVASKLNSFVFKDTSSSSSFSGQAEYSELPRNEILGRIVRDSMNKPMEIWILRSKLDSILKSSGFTDTEVILHEWRSKAIIEADKGKFTKKRSLYQDGDSIRVVVLKIQDNIYESTDDQVDDTIQSIRSVKGIHVAKLVPEVVEEEIV